MFSMFRTAAVAAMLASVCSANPTPVDIVVSKPQNDLVYRQALEMARQPRLEKRLSAEFDMTRVWKNEVLFAGSWMDVNQVGATESVSLAVTCLDCYTKGSVTARLTDKEIINPTVRLEFNGVEAYVDMEVAVSAGASYAVNLFASNSPIGLGFPGLSVGVVFYVDLVFSLSEEIDLEGGFYVKLDDSAYLEASVFGGEITDHFFDGLSSKSLAVTVKVGRATFKADLRLRVQCGAEAEFFGLGGAAELGIYANLVEFVAVLESTPTCALQSTEWWDLNLGAFAHLDVVIDYKTIGAIPTVSTTLLSAPTFTQCWLPIGGLPGGSPAETGGYLTATTITVPAGTTPALSIIVSSPPETGASISATTTTFSSATKSGTLSSTAEDGYSEKLTVTSVPAVIGAPSVTGSASLTTSTLKYPLGNSSAPAVGTGSSRSTGGNDLVTSTVYSTTVYTITSCAASVVNCPASYQQEILVTQTVDVYTTICPVTAVVTPPAASSVSAGSIGLTTTVDTVVITDVVVLVPVASPVAQTFMPGSTLVLPSVRTLTATVNVVPAASSSTPALPFVDGVKNAAQWNNGTSAISTPALSTGIANASWSHTITPVPAKTSVLTAGAASRDIGRGLVFVAGGFAAWVLF